MLFMYFVFFFGFSADGEGCRKGPICGWGAHTPERPFFGGAAPVLREFKPVSFSRAPNLPTTICQQNDFPPLFFSKRTKVRCYRWNHHGGTTGNWIRTREGPRKIIAHFQIWGIGTSGSLPKLVELVYIYLSSLPDSPYIFIAASCCKFSFFSSFF